MREMELERQQRLLPNSTVCPQPVGNQHGEVNVTKPLLVRLTIPLVDEERLRVWEPLVFRQWLPLHDEDALTATEEEMELRFWIDKECLHHFGELNLDDISSYA